MNACAFFLTAALTLNQPPLLPDRPPPRPVDLPPPPAAPLAVPVKPITLDEFAATFKPQPGTYEIVFLHPRKKCPVSVTFTLPEGCPKMVVGRHAIAFDYGKHEVDVRFRLGGKVSVTTK